VLSKIFETKDEGFTFSFGLSDEGLAELAKEDINIGTPNDTQPGTKSSKKKKKKKDKGEIARASLSDVTTSENERKGVITDPLKKESKKVKDSRPDEPKSKSQEHKKSGNELGKKKGKSKASIPDDNEDWFDPQPQQPMTSSIPAAKSTPGPFIRSSKNPSLDAEAQQKLKFGDGKNLVAAAPPKVRNQLWISNPFAMGSFSFSFNVDPDK
jgi:hypothetical protein